MQAGRCVEGRKLGWTLPVQAPNEGCPAFFAFQPAVLMLPWKRRSESPLGRTTTLGETATAVLAASHALAGRTAEAQRTMDHLRQLGPPLRLANLTDWLPIQRPDDLATLVDGLRKAGLPE